MWPFEALEMAVTGPLKPAKGRFVQPAVPTQAIAFVEFAPLKLPPTYTVLDASSHSSAETCPESPVSGTTADVFGLNRAAPGDSIPPRLVKFPPTTTPAIVPSCITK